jgi:mannose-1-phosphate guanylyltransferase
MPGELRRGVVAVLPADHRVADGAAFREALAAAARAVERDDVVVTLGVRPNRPETGYGYLEMGPPRAAGEGLRRVERFHEKPDAEAARAYLEAGDFLWNAGIFVFRGDSMLRWIERFEPEIGEALRRIARRPEELDRIYPEIPSISIDYAVMERLEQIAGLPLDCGWSDLGSWEALDEALGGVETANTTHGDVFAFDAGDNLLWADEGTIAVIGVSGLAVVRTGDAVLVLPKERSQEVRRIVDELRSRGRDELL